MSKIEDGGPALGWEVYRDEILRRTRIAHDVMKRALVVVECDQTFQSHDEKERLVADLRRAIKLHDFEPSATRTKGDGE